MMVDPEWLVLLGAGLWVGCGGLLGFLAPERVPREFSILFIALGVIGGGIGISVFLPDAQTDVIVLASAVAFAVLPVVTTAYLLWAFPKTPPPEKPRRMGKRSEDDD